MMVQYQVKSSCQAIATNAAGEALPPMCIFDFGAVSFSSAMAFAR